MSAAGGTSNPIDVPEATVTHFFTTGRILSFFPQVNANGFTFERKNVPDSLVDTLVGSTTDLQHCKAGYGVNDPLVHGATNTTVGAITKAVATEDGIYILNKIERVCAKSFGFMPEDFAPGSVLGKLSQECDYLLPESEWVVVDKSDSSKVLSRHAFTDGLDLGFPIHPQGLWAGSHLGGDGKMQYHYFEGNPVYLSVTPKSFAGVGHVADPADPTAQITKLAASRLMAAGKVKNFIDKAIKHHGALTEKAKAAGMSIDEFAEKHKHDGDQTGEQARFYLGVLKKAAHSNSFLPSVDDGPAAPESMIMADYPTHDSNFMAGDYFNHPDLLSADVAAWENEPDNLDEPDNLYAACWSEDDWSNRSDGNPAQVKRRALKIKNKKGEFDRNRLIAAYHALTGTRGDIASATNIPSAVRAHALALVRHGLKETKPKTTTKGVSTQVQLNIAGLSLSADQETAILAEVERNLLASQKVYSKNDLDAITAERDDLKTQVSTLTASVNELKETVTAISTERDTASATVKQHEADKLCAARYDALNKVHAFSDDEKNADTHADYIKSLASMSEDGFKIELQAREIKGLKSNRASATAFTPGVNPVPTINLGSTVTEGAVNPAVLY